MPKSSVTLSNLSRYKDTRIFDEGGDLEFELQTQPDEFNNIPQGSQTHVVRSHEVGFLDIVAVRYYGVGYERMWWSIAQANNIINPESEMYPGMELVIPGRDRLTSFIGRPGNAK